MVDIAQFINEEGLFDGRYKLIKLLSEEGGTADVWLAEDCETEDEVYNDESEELQDIEGTGVLVAIKIYRPKNSLDMDGIRDFRNEFKTVHNCHHANLLTPKGFNTLDDMPYLVMPYCRMGSAEEIVGKLTEKKELWKFVLHVASGLSYLHSLERPIVHQDIKPANILIDNNGYYCITDFGISVQKDNDLEDNKSSGTIPYMPPERFKEDYESNPQSDIWALGATLYELITGKHPFKDGGIEQKSDTQIPKINSNIPKGIKKIVYGCLNYDPRKRPTAEEIEEIARRNSDNKRLLFIVLPVFISTLAILASAIGWMRFKPVQTDPFMVLKMSGDSIINIEKQKASTSELIDSKLSRSRFEEALKKYNLALKKKTEEPLKRDSIILMLNSINNIFPLLDQYDSINAILHLAEEDNVPFRIKEYSIKRNEISQIIKNKIKQL